MRTFLFDLLTLLSIGFLLQPAGYGQTVMRTAGEIYDTARPSIVEVISKGCKDPLESARSGTGFVVSADGVIFTASHVVADYTITPNGPIPVYCRDISIHFSAPRPTLQPAKILSVANPVKSVVADYSILKVEGSGLPHLALGTLGQVRVGDPVIALGYEMGASAPLLVTETVSAIGMMPSVRQFVYRRSLVPVKGLILEGPVNRGLSGAPVISNATGQVVGIAVERFGGVSDKLKKVRQQIMASRGSGGVLIQGVNPNVSILQLINVLDNFLSNGMGAAMSIDYSRQAYESILNSFHR